MTRARGGHAALAAEALRSLENVSAWSQQVTPDSVDNGSSFPDPAWMRSMSDPISQLRVANAPQSAHTFVQMTGKGVEKTLEASWGPGVWRCPSTDHPIEVVR